MTCCEHGIKRGSSVKWTQVQHRTAIPSAGVA